MDSNKDLDELINNHLNIKKYLDRKVVERTANLFISFEGQFVSNVGGETFYKPPYKEITISIFYSHCDEMHTNAFQSFCTTVSETLTELCQDHPSASHIIDCYEKFTHHISLALIQKQFILSSVRDVEDTVKKVTNIATKATGIAKEASKVSGLAKHTAREAQSASENAKTIAARAQEVFDNSLVNYITILGIFASIIITVFGGISLTNATVKLLESEHDLPMMVFAVSFLMIGFISILIVLITWISSLRKDTEYRSAVKWWILGGFSLLAICSGLYLQHKVKVSTDCQIGYYTCIHMDGLKTPYVSNRDKKENNKETESD